jgi:uncharacterized protein (TIGR00156 family)
MTLIIPMFFTPGDFRRWLYRKPIININLENYMTNKLLRLLLLLSFSTGVSAEFVGPGASSGTTTVKSIDGMKDDAKVTLEGYIVKEIKPEHYTFKDATGEIEIEIDHEDFRGIKVTPETKIRIMGEVDKDWNSTTIDVDKVELVK